jgi:hypothetical protein
LKNSLIAALLSASIILVGCEEYGLGDLDGVYYEEEVYEKSLKVGYRTEDDIDENYTFKLGDTVTVVVDNGNEEYGPISMYIYLYKLEGDREVGIWNYENPKDPSHVWSRFNILEESFIEAGDYKLRIYLGDKYFGEVDFEMVEQ